MQLVLLSNFWLYVFDQDPFCFSGPQVFSSIKWEIELNYSFHYLSVLIFVKILFFPFLFKNLWFLNWRIIVLQNYAGFCQTSKWISHRYTYVPSLWTFPPLHSPSHPFRLLQSPGLSSLSHTANSHWLSILHMVM